MDVRTWHTHLASARRRRTPCSRRRRRRRARHGAASLRRPPGTPLSGSHCRQLQQHQRPSSSTKKRSRDTGTAAMAELSSPSRRRQTEGEAATEPVNVAMDALLITAILRRGNGPVIWPFLTRGDMAGLVGPGVSSRRRR